MLCQAVECTISPENFPRSGERQPTSEPIDWIEAPVIALLLQTPGTTPENISCLKYPAYHPVHPCPHSNPVCLPLSSLAPLPAPHG